MSRKAEGRETFGRIERFMKTEYSFLRRMDKGAISSRYGAPQRRYSLGSVPEGKKWTRQNTPRLYITMNSDDIEVEIVLKKALGGCTKIEAGPMSAVGVDTVRVTLPTGLALVARVHVCEEELQLRQYHFKLEDESLFYPHALALLSFIFHNGL